MPVILYIFLALVFMDTSFFDSGESPSVTKLQLFLNFALMGLVSFGGVLPWAHRFLVEKQRWLTHKEFTETLGLGQLLPGPNIVNVSIMVGARFHGPLGSFLAFSGLMLAPFLIMMLLAVFYAHYGHFTKVQYVCQGVGAASAGLVLATGLKMLRKQQGSLLSLAIVALTFMTSALLKWPLLIILLILGPCGIALAWKEDRS